MVKQAFRNLRQSFAAWRATQDFVHGIVQLLIALDQLANVLTNPFSKQTWCDETISSRCGRLGHRYPYKFWKVIIDAMFYPFQGPNHCVNAYHKELTRYQFPPEMRGAPPAEDKKPETTVS